MHTSELIGVQEVHCNLTIEDCEITLQCVSASWMVLLDVGVQIGGNRIQVQGIALHNLHILDI